MKPALLPDDAGPPASYGVDVGAEAALLTPHDLSALHDRLARTLVRRRWLKIGAGAAAVIGALTALLALFGPARPPDTARVDTNGLAPAAGLAVPPSIPASTTAPCPGAPPPPAPVPKRASITRPAPRVVEDAPPDDGLAIEGSRLRAQLLLYERARDALTRGDGARALEHAVVLRTRYADGPLRVEAALVEVQALHLLGRDDDARAALDALAVDPAAGEKADVLDGLRRSLAPPETPPEHAPTEEARPIIGAEPAPTEESAP
jgi:hypothetical protein